MYTYLRVRLNINTNINRKTRLLIQRVFLFPYYLLLLRSITNEVSSLLLLKKSSLVNFLGVDNLTYAYVVKPLLHLPLNPVHYCISRTHPFSYIFIRSFVQSRFPHFSSDNPFQLWFSFFSNSHLMPRLLLRIKALFLPRSCLFYSWFLVEYTSLW